MAARALRPGSWYLPAMLLGISLGGFFDGILLHQILQWHHLLSLVPGMADIRLQILWDGIFHGLMYLLALLALYGLWRGRGTPVSARRTAGCLCAGFGLWHVVDAVISHWLLGIHRIRPESSMPLAWDLGWLIAFGVLPLIVGLVLFARHPGQDQRRPLATVGCLAILSLAAGVWALQPPAGVPLTTVIFPPWTPAERVAEILRGTGAGILWEDAESGIALLRLEPAQRWSLWRQAALFVSGAGLPEGCFGWSTTG